MPNKFLLLVIVGIFFSSMALVRWQWPSGYGSLVFCDVGQGDAILIQQGWLQILVDTGPDSKVLGCLEKYMPWQDRTIELLVLTHPDADHVGGFLSLVGSYSFGEIWISSAAKETELWQQILEEIELLRQHNPPTKLVKPIALEAYQLGQNIEIRVVNPVLRVLPTSGGRVTTTETKLSDITSFNSPLKNVPNDESIALYIDFMHVTIFLPGDIEEKRELALLSQGLISKANIAKGAHHGSKSSSSQRLLTTVLPELFVVSSGLNNRYGHPAPEVIKRVALLEIPIIQTSEEGLIEIRLSSKHWWVATR